jgi:hypothetical protein
MKCLNFAKFRKKGLNFFKKCPSPSGAKTNSFYHSYVSRAMIAVRMTWKGRMWEYVDIPYYYRPRSSFLFAYRKKAWIEFQ